MCSILEEESKILVKRVKSVQIKLDFNRKKSLFFETNS